MSVAFDWFRNILRFHPEVTFFLVLGLGYALGKLRIGSFTLGAVTGTLLAGVLVGQLGLKISGDVKQCFFLLFLFSIGFRTGPQFFRGMRRDGLQQALLAAIVATTGLVVAFIVSKLLGYPAGTAAGVVAGSLTESATIGTATDAITRLALSDADRQMLTNQIPVAFAVTYLVGVIGAAWILSQLAPKLMKVDLPAACRELEDKMQGTGAQGIPGRREFELRAYTIEEGSPLAGASISEMEASMGDQRLFIDRIRRDGVVMNAAPDTVLRAGDTISAAGRRTLLVERMLGPTSGVREIDDRELLDMEAESLDVVVTSKAIDGHRLGELAREQGARGVFVLRLARAGTPVLISPETVINRGDVLTLVGSASRVEAVVNKIGVADRATNATDMVLVSLGIVAGALIGVPALLVGGVEIGLSLSVGVLLGGLVCGWLRSVEPRLFGRIPGPTLWIFESIGLTGFVAIVGLNAGPDFVKGLQSSGLSLLFAGILTSSIPMLVGVFVGHKIMKMHAGVMLGVCAGALTATPALAAVQEAAKSAVPTLGYGVAYAVGNVLFALWGTVIVTLVT
ncbi:aspartate-alanine antiporter [Caballeronia sp. LZ065]|uniref:aspartate-alanine antiporter n=1 Tax=Caballeronia sp. LZ065 TaxID=3038571 RepID=UPI00285781BC|nr:aspartate-alanine antiporter [Caballeronia sp. LZ065]MDR5781373.1 aspartate-alanine antiporter [Caballeronia sp. LZ065]